MVRLQQVVLLANNNTNTTVLVVATQRKESFGIEQCSLLEKLNLLSWSADLPRNQSELKSPLGRKRSIQS